MTTTEHPDWSRLLQTWDAQQSGYLRDRELRFRIVLDALSNLPGESHRILDVGAGPGSFAARILKRMPSAEVVALDMDPVLLAIGAGALGDADGRLSWLDTDLRVPGWESGLGDRPFDAIVSSTALHWLSPAQLTAVYTAFARIIGPGGRFLNADHMAYDASLPTLVALGRAASDRRSTDAFGSVGVPDWDEWWKGLADIPALAGARVERDRRNKQRVSNEQDHIPLTRLSTLRLHVTVLREVGFTEVATIWQDHDDRVLLAIR